jgi:type IV secretion system protein VirD4
MPGKRRSSDFLPRSHALLTPGEVMQLPAEDELVLVSGCPPIRAKKARYYEDRELTR